MKIAILLSTLSQTGPGFVMRDLADELSTRYDVYIWTLTKLQNNADKINFTEKVVVNELDFSGGKVTADMVSALSSSLRDNNIKVVISNGIRMDALVTKLHNDDMLKVSVSHNNPFEDYPKLYGFLKGNGMAFFQMRLFKNMDYVVTLNPSLEKLHQFFLGKSNVKLILNGVQTINADSLDNRVKFGMVGTFNHRKNQAFVLKNLNDKKIILYGDGPLKDGLMKRFNTENIIWAGFTHDKERIYSSFDVLVSPSQSEGLPLNVLEALSAGKPVILSNIPAHRYIASFLPTDAYRLFSNVREFVEAIDHYSGYEEVGDTRLSENIKDAYKKYFSAEVMANRYDELIQEASKIHMTDRRLGE